MGFIVRIVFAALLMCASMAAADYSQKYFMDGALQFLKEDMVYTNKKQWPAELDKISERYQELSDAYDLKKITDDEYTKKSHDLEKEEQDVLLYGIGKKRMIRTSCSKERQKILIQKKNLQHYRRQTKAYSENTNPYMLLARCHGVYALGFLLFGCTVCKTEEKII